MYCYLVRFKNKPTKKFLLYRRLFGHHHHNRFVVPLLAMSGHRGKRSFCIRFGIFCFIKVHFQIIFFPLFRNRVINFSGYRIEQQCGETIFPPGSEYSIIGAKLTTGTGLMIKPHQKNRDRRFAIQALQFVYPEMCDRSASPAITPNRR